ncbi:MAG: hypothetical protein J6A75_05170 [Lachnospiraceae bacterium]|nr:hypothetical protein [Lachnospiraceae bacterium]
MQYVLYRKNLKQFIGYTDTGKVERVSALEEAQIFTTPNETRSARKKATKKTAYFCVYAVMENGKLEKVYDEVPKRKLFSKEERMQIYKNKRLLLS